MQPLRPSPTSPGLIQIFFFLITGVLGFFFLEGSVLVAGCQVVKAGLDVLVVVINLFLIKQGLGVEALQGLSQLQELPFAVLPVTPLVADVLRKTKPRKKTQI